MSKDTFCWISLTVPQNQHISWYLPFLSKATIRYGLGLSLCGSGARRYAGCMNEQMCFDVEIVRSLDCARLGWPGASQLQDGSRLGGNHEYVDLRYLSWADAIDVAREEREIIDRIQRADDPDNEWAVIRRSLCPRRGHGSHACGYGRHRPRRRGRHDPRACTDRRYVNPQVGASSRHLARPPPPVRLRHRAGDERHP